MFLLARRYVVGLILGAVAALVAITAIDTSYYGSAGGDADAGDNTGDLLLVLILGGVVLSAVIIPILGLLRRRSSRAENGPGWPPRRSRHTVTFRNWPIMPPEDQRGEVPVWLSIAALIVGMATGLGGLAVAVVTA